MGDDNAQINNQAGDMEQRVTKNTHIPPPRHPKDYNLNDEVAEYFARQIIEQCDSLPLNESISFNADTLITQKAVNKIDEHFGISSEGRASNTEMYVQHFSGTSDIQKRYHTVLKTVYYCKFL